jgi:hypothetical protein
MLVIADSSGDDDWQVTPSSEPYSVQAPKPGSPTNEYGFESFCKPERFILAADAEFKGIPIANAEIAVKKTIIFTTSRCLIRRSSERSLETVVVCGEEMPTE